MKMMSRIVHLKGNCGYGCCPSFWIKNKKSKRLAHGIQRAREKRAVDKELATW